MISMKRILFVINSLGLGGAEKSLISLLNTLDFDRYLVDLLMFQPQGMFLKLLPESVNILPVPDFLTSNDSVLHQIKKPKYLSARLSASFALRMNNRTKKLHPAQCYWKYTHNCFDILDVKYDVAVAWGQGNPTHFVAEKVLANKKLAVINVNYSGAGHNKEFDSPFYELFDCIVTVSDDLNMLTRKTFPQYADRMVTLYDITNAEMIWQLADEGNPFSNETCQLILVTAGRLTPQKGYDLAIDAANILSDREIDFKWFFVGDGISRKELEQQIAKYDLKQRVILTGAKDNPYVYMKNADIYVQTSRFEGYCLTISEARILNKPIVSTDFDVVHNQLTNERNGLIVDMNGIAIAEAIIRLSNDEQLRDSLIENLKREKKGNTEEIEKLYRLIEE